VPVATPLKPNKPRAYLVDDHPLVRSYLALLLETQAGVKVAGYSEDADKARQQIPEVKPDLVVLDLSLGTGHGLDLIRDLLLRDPTTKILVFSAHDEETFAARVQQAGAKGYLQKTAPAPTIIEAVRKIIAGGAFFTMDPARLPSPPANGTQALAPGDLQVKRLSDRELQVFEAVGQGRSTKAIAESLGVDVKTVETYRARIKVKLGIETATALLLAAHDWVSQRNPGAKAPAAAAR
jgi:DNA-binding NarL/FixJ family response regulator